MSVKITDNTTSVTFAIKQQANLFLRQAEDELERIADPMTPKKSGHLRREKLKTVIGLSGKVVWKVRYAPIQEAKQFSHYTTAGTGPHFAEKAAKRLPSRTEAIAKRVFR